MRAEGTEMWEESEEERTDLWRREKAKASKEAKRGRGVQEKVTKTRIAEIWGMGAQKNGEAKRERVPKKMRGRKQTLGREKQGSKASNVYAPALL